MAAVEVVQGAVQAAAYLAPGVLAVVVMGRHTLVRREQMVRQILVVEAVVKQMVLCRGHQAVAVS